MKHLFLKHTFIFTAPLVLFLAFPLWVVHVSAEITSAEEVIVRFQDNSSPQYIGKAYFPFEQNIKAALLRSTMPDVVAVGNSRVLQIRDVFFRDDVAFYNFGDAGSVQELSMFLAALAGGNEPSVVIIGLEQSFFVRKEDENLGTEGSRWPNMLHLIRSVYLDYLGGKFSVRELRTSGVERENRVGLHALVNKEGMRPDGSYRYGKAIADPLNPTREDYEFKDTFRRIEKGINLFTSGEDVLPEKLLALESFLDKVAERGVHVVLFLPPYAPTVYGRVLSEGRKYAYLSRIEESVLPSVERHGFSFFDFSDATKIESSDAEFIDGLHGSEKTYLRLFIYMAERDAQLRRLVSVRDLTAALEETESDLEVFHEEDAR